MKPLYEDPVARTGCRIATGGCLLWLIGAIGIPIIFIMLIASI